MKRDQSSIKEWIPQEKRPLLTHKCMESLMRLRLRDNETPRHVDAMCAARDFYEGNIDRNYLFRPYVNQEVEFLLGVINELWEHAKGMQGVPEDRVQEARRKAALLTAKPKRKGT